jgi:hypothetical protein
MGVSTRSSEGQRPVVDPAPRWAQKSRCGGKYGAIPWPAQGRPDTPIQARERAYESGRDSARWALAPAPEGPSRGREYAAASLMQGCAAPRLVDFQRLRPASGRHARAYVSPRFLLYALPRLRVLSIEAAGVGPTMEPRPAE